LEGCLLTLFHIAAIYSAILTSKLTALTPPAITEAAIKAGLPVQSLPALLSEYKTNITAIPGMNSTIEAGVESAVARAAAESFR